MRLTTLLITMVLLAGNGRSDPQAEPGSGTERFTRAAGRYNYTELKTLAAEYEALTNKNPSPDSLLLLGLMYWRLELIAFCTDNTPEIKKYGKLALSTLQQAQDAGSDPYLTASHKALAAQLLAGLSITNGARFGPRAAKELKVAGKSRPQGYFTQLIEAINLYQAPSFAGGAPEKAVLQLKNQSERYPDSLDVTIHLAQALHKAGNTKKALSLITPVLSSHPENLFAKKTAAILNGKR